MKRILVKVGRGLLWFGRTLDKILGYMPNVPGEILALAIMIGLGMIYMIWRAVCWGFNYHLFGSLVVVITSTFAVVSVVLALKSYRKSP